MSHRHRCVRRVDVAGEWCAPSVPLREVVAVRVVDGRTSGGLSLVLLPRVLARGRGADLLTRHTSHLAHLGTSRCRTCMQHAGAAVEVGVPLPPRTPPVVCRKVAAVLRAGRLPLPMPSRVAARAEVRVPVRGKDVNLLARRTSH